MIHRYGSLLDLSRWEQVRLVPRVCQLQMTRLSTFWKHRWGGLPMREQLSTRWLQSTVSSPIWATLPSAFARQCLKFDRTPAPSAPLQPLRAHRKLLAWFLLFQSLEQSLFSLAGRFVFHPVVNARKGAAGGCAMFPQTLRGFYDQRFVLLSYRRA